MPVRFLIVDDHEWVRRGVIRTVSSHSGWEIVGEAGNGREAVANSRSLCPDVVIMDITMPELNGIEATQEILQHSPGIRIVIFTMHVSEQLVSKAIEAGARAYVAKTHSTQELIVAVEAVLRGARFFTSVFSPQMVEAILSHDGQGRRPGSLTTREMQVVTLLAAGKNNKEAAALLRISLRTVEKHRANIMNKLHLQSIGDLVHYAMANGLDRFTETA